MVNVLSRLRRCLHLDRRSPATTTAVTTAQPTSTTPKMADHKKVIVQFRKTASEEDKTRTLDSLKAQGAQIINDDNRDSKILPFVSLSLPSDHFDALAQECSLGSHAVVQNVEEDKEMHIM